MMTTKLKQTLVAIAASAILTTPAYAERKPRIDLGTQGIVLVDNNTYTYGGMRVGIDIPLRDQSPALFLYQHTSLMGSYNTGQFEMELDAGIKYSPEFSGLNKGSTRTIDLDFFTGSGLMLGEQNRFTFKAGIETRLRLLGPALGFLEASGGIALWPDVPPAAYGSITIGVSM